VAKSAALFRQAGVFAAVNEAPAYRCHPCTSAKQPGTQQVAVRPRFAGSTQMHRRKIAFATRSGRQTAHAADREGCLRSSLLSAPLCKRARESTTRARMQWVPLPRDRASRPLGHQATARARLSPHRFASASASSPESRRPVRSLVPHPIPAAWGGGMRTGDPRLLATSATRTNSLRAELEAMRTGTRPRCCLRAGFGVRPAQALLTRLD